MRRGVTGDPRGFRRVLTLFGIVKGCQNLNSSTPQVAQVDKNESSFQFYVWIYITSQ